MNFNKVSLPVAVQIKQHAHMFNFYISIQKSVCIRLKSYSSLELHRYIQQNPCIIVFSHWPSRPSPAKPGTLYQYGPLFQHVDSKIPIWCAMPYAWLHGAHDGLEKAASYKWNKNAKMKDIAILCETNELTQNMCTCENRKIRQKLAINRSMLSSCNLSSESS